MRVWMLILLIVAFPVHASEFQFIKLSPEFESYLTEKPDPQVQGFAKAFNVQPLAAKNNIQNKMASALLGGGSLEKSTFPTDGGEESLLYEEIRKHLEASHEGIAKTEIQSINRINQQFNLGSSNFSGFSWQKPFGVVSVHVDRQVNPNVFGQNWLVMDTFSFEVEATTFLEKLTGEGLGQMSAAEIGAFAGITFKRVYTYWHYAESYQKGLTADFSRLFLPFLSFNRKGMERMGDEEFMKREDVWTSSVGGLISTPPIYNLSFSAGVLAHYDFQNSTTVQKAASHDERYRLGVVSKKNIGVGATLGLQLDFFKLIKLSLLQYDLNYEYTSGKEFTLGFSNEEYSDLKTRPAEQTELKKILAGTGEIKTLAPYIKRMDESSSESFEHKGSLLVWGKAVKTKTEQVRVIKDEAVKVFYKNYSQNVKVVQNILSRLFSAVVYKLLKLPVGVKNAAIFSQQVTLEFEANHPQSVDPNISRIDSTEQFSFVLTQYYNASRTDRWIDRHFKDDVIWFVDKFTTLPKTYKIDIRKELLKGPILVESHFRVEHAGLVYVIESPEDLVFKKIAHVCGSKKVNDWSNEKKRQALLRKKHTGKELCVKKIGNDFISFKTDYHNNHLKPSITKFKAFLTQYYKNADGLHDLVELFGEENSFVNGKLQARTSLGNDFNTAFSSGQFRGLGVIDNFKRSTGSRMPASIVNE